MSARRATRPLPTPLRITHALMLASMTVRDLARCLTLSHDTIRRALAELRRRGMVEVGGRESAWSGQRRYVWRLKWLRRACGREN